MWEKKKPKEESQGGFVGFFLFNLWKSLFCVWNINMHKVKKKKKKDIDVENRHNLYDT